MTPEQINAATGKLVYECQWCQATTNIGWWSGLWVAVCLRPSHCDALESEFFAAQKAAAEDDE